jgi:hypothetical protein
LPRAAEVVVGTPCCRASSDRLEPFVADAVDDIRRAIAEHFGQRAGQVGEVARGGVRLPLPTRWFQNAALLRRAKRLITGNAGVSLAYS